MDFFLVCVTFENVITNTSEKNKFMLGGMTPVESLQILPHFIRHTKTRNFLATL